MKFLDPHEKIVIELKDEIRRLRHENQKLRSNIASAPAATGGEKPLSNTTTSTTTTTIATIFYQMRSCFLFMNRSRELCGKCRQQTAAESIAISIAGGSKGDQCRGFSIGGQAAQETASH